MATNGIAAIGDFGNAEIIGRYGETRDDLVSFTSVA